MHIAQKFCGISSRANREYFAYALYNVSVKSPSHLLNANFNLFSITIKIISTWAVCNAYVYCVLLA